MMKKLILLLILSLALIILPSCERDVHHDESDYMLEIPYQEDFKILQISDIHLGNKDDLEKAFAFMDLTISEANADLIVLTGDLFTFATKNVAKKVFNFIASYDTYWTVCWGNHDEQCYFSIDWVTNYLNNYGEKCIFKDVHGDDVFGYSNFVINLMENDSIKEQVYLVDTNRYYYGSYWGYDTVHADQVAWYERMVNYSTSLNNGEVIPSVLYCHIPLPEYNDAFDAIETGEAILEQGEKGEMSTPAKINNGFFDKIVELGSTKAISVGHDHYNDFRILYKGVYFIYGLKATDRIYYREDMMGGKMIIIHSDNTLSFLEIYHTYAEVK